MTQQNVFMELSELNATADKVRLLARRICPTHPILFEGKITGVRENQGRGSNQPYSARKKVRRITQNTG